MIMTLASGISLLYCWMYYYERSFQNKNCSETLMSGYRFLVNKNINKSTRKIIILFLGIMLVWGIFIQYLPIYLIEQYHYGSTSIGIFIASCGIIFGVTFTCLLKILIKYFTILMIIKYSLILLFFSILLMTLCSTEIFQWVLIDFIAVGTAICNSTF